MSGNLDGFSIFVTCLVAAVSLLCLYGLAWLCFGRSELSEEKTVSAKVVATKFQPHREGGHFATGVGTNGQFNTMYVDDSEDEQDIVLLRSVETGRIEIDNPDLLDNVKQGEEVQLTYQEKYTYWSWKPYEKSFSCYVPVSVKTSKGEEIKV
jgi:hypothetical protein